ncbi:DUF4836 family protein [Chitinophaga lutea]
MKRTISKALLFISGAAVLMLAACSKAPEQGKHIPKTAALVMGVNSKQLQDKLVSEGLTFEKMAEAVQQHDTSNTMTKAMKDAANSGVDLQGDVYVAVVPGEGAEKGYAMVVAKLNDQAKFEAFLKEKADKPVDIKQGKDFKYSENGEAAIGFDKDKVIGIFGLSQGSKFGMPDADTSNNAALSAKLDAIFHLKADESMANVETFKAVQKEKGDAFFWMSNEKLMSLNPEAMQMMGPQAMMLTNVKKLVKDSYQTASVHFEKGKISVDNASYAGPEMREIMKKYPMKPINMSALEKYPSENVVGFLLLNYDMHMLNDIAKLLGLDGMVNLGLSQAGLTLEDLLNAFSGEISYIASDFSITSQPSEWDTTYKVTKPEVKWVFSMKVADKKAFEKVMSSPQIAQMFTKQGDNYIANPMISAGKGVSITSERILVASDETLLSAYAEGKGKVKLDEGVEGKVKGSVLGMYVNVEKLVNQIPANESELPDSIMNDIRGLVKDISVASQPAESKVQRSKIEVNFMNEGQNSLVQIVKFAQKMYGYYQAKEKERAALWGDADSVATDSAATVVDSAAAPVAP